MQEMCESPPRMFIELQETTGSTHTQPPFGQTLHIERRNFYSINQVKPSSGS